MKLTPGASVEKKKQKQNRDQIRIHGEIVCVCMCVCERDIEIVCKERGCVLVKKNECVLEGER